MYYQLYSEFNCTNMFLYPTLSVFAIFSWVFQFQKCSVCAAHFINEAKLNLKKKHTTIKQTYVLSIKYVLQIHFYYLY